MPKRKKSDGLPENFPSPWYEEKISATKIESGGEVFFDDEIC